MKKILRTAVIGLFAVAGVSEAALRLSWKNPHRLPAKDVYTHHPDVHAEFPPMDEVYDTTPEKIRFNTSASGFIESSRTRKADLRDPAADFDVAVGGSTTECSSIQEDFRWPDLLDRPTLNFGKGRMYSIHSYYNMKYALESLRLRPKRIFVMDGINNLSRYLRMGTGSFEVEAYRYVKWNPWIDFIAENSYLASFVKGLTSSRIDYRTFLLRERERSESVPRISDGEFEGFLEANREKMYESFLSIYRRMHSLARAHGATLVVLTQPHSYRPDYTPRKRDFRTFPVIETAKNVDPGLREESLIASTFVDGKRTDVAQAGRLMDEVNRITLRVAGELGTPAIDTAGCFSEKDVSGLIYDEVHMTKEGARHFAECIRRALP